MSPPAAAAPPTVTALFPAGASRGQTVEITATGTFERWPVQVWVDRPGVTVQPGKDKGKLTVTVAADAEPGTAWVRLYDDEGAAALRPFLIGTLPEVLEKEPNDDARKPQVLTGNATINGRLEKAGDVDCFALSLRQGQTLVASLEANDTLASPMDGVLQIVSADGFVLEQNHDFHGLDPQAVYTAPRDGTYVVRVFAFPEKADSSIRFSGSELYVYRLTVTTGGFADHAWPLAVARAEPGPVALVGWNIPEGAQRLAVPAGDTLLATLLHPQVANPVQVRREPHATLMQAPTSSPDQPQQLPLPATVSGRLDKAGAVHAYAFQGKKGQRVTFQIEARTLGFPLDPVLRVLDPAGKSLAMAQVNQLGRDPELVFAPTVDGPYRLEVRDLHGDGGPRHVYRLRALLPEPDFTLTLAADRFTLTPGKPLDIPVTVVRGVGFKGDIDLVAEGLPPGVTATTLPANPKTLTLRLTAEKAVPATAFRIVGQVKDQPALTRPARATLVGFAESTTHIWLTVAK